MAREKNKKEKAERKWKWSDVGGFLKRSSLAIIKGEFLLRLPVGKYFIHIIWTFFLFWMSIFLSLKMEKTFTRVEDNKKILNEVEISRAHKTVELSSLDRMSTVKDMLKEQGSLLEPAVVPPAMIKK